MTDQLKYYECLITGKMNDLFAQLTDDVQLNTHMNGKGAGFNDIRKIIAKEKEFVDLNVLNAKLVDSVSDGNSRVYEYLLELKNNRELPAAVFADKDNDKFSSVRIYHSTYPLNEGHIYREPVFDKDKELEGPDVIREYFKLLRDGNAEDIAGIFSDNYAYFREPAGNQWVYSNVDLINHYKKILNDGGIELSFHNHLYCESENMYAVEFTCNKWGNIELKPQAGMAVYELDKITGKIKGARVYDDVDTAFRKE